MLDITKYTQDAITLLKKMISIPSFSREEKDVADAIELFIRSKGVETKRLLNNIYALNKHFDPIKPSIFLNSHHDTVKPATGYNTNPFVPTEIDGKIIGLGSNDAGGPLVSLISTFLYFNDRTDLPFNVIISATAEEEISGSNGVELLLNDTAFIKELRGSTIIGALVGEPTKMQMAVAERGLLVIDAATHGKAGHAARGEGINALNIAVKDITEINSMVFDRVSPLTGKTTTNVTVIETENKAHNVVPSICHFVIDVRVNELYTFDEMLATLRSKLTCDLNPRNSRLRSTMIPMDHPIVMAGKKLGLPHYGSPTTSDKALMYFPALKIGPGDSARSHTANEYIYPHEIEQGIAGYIELLEETKSFLLP